MTLNNDETLIGDELLDSFNLQSGSVHKVSVSDPRQSLMSGAFHHDVFGDALNMHVVDVVELQNAKNSIELEPCISFNITFHGTIDFSLGEKRFQIDNRSSEVNCTAVIVTQREIMTRYLSAGRKIKKVNVSIPIRVLIERCKNQVEAEQLSLLISTHAFVIDWPASERTVSLAEELMQKVGGEGVIHSLELEQLTLLLLTICLKKLSQLRLADSPEVDAVIVPDEFKFKSLIDENLHENITLNDLAVMCGMSVSTLQRQFKSNYGITVSDYIRSRRLERAKSEMLVYGITIGEAAYLAGYNHSSNFISAFKKQFSVTPAQMMKAHQSNL